MAKEKDLLIEFLGEYAIEAVEKGLDIFEKIKSGISVADIKGSKYALKVRSEASALRFYEVFVNIWKDEVEVHCDCPAMDRFGSCKHTVAAAIYILIKVHGMTFSKIEDIFNDDYDDEFWLDDDDDHVISTGKTSTAKTIAEKSKIIPLAPSAVPEPSLLLNDKAWKSFQSTPNNAFYTAHSLQHLYPTAQALKNITLDRINEQDVVFYFSYKQNKATSFQSQIKYDRHTTFYYKCDCMEANVLCSNVRFAFEILEQKKSRYVFLNYKDWTEEQNKLLEPFGLTLADKEAAKIEFSVDNRGSLTMKQPSWLWKTDFTDNIKGLKQIFSLQANGKASRPLPAINTVIDFEIGFLLNLTSQHFKTGFELELIKVYEKSNKKQFKKLSIHQNDTLSLLKGLPDEVYELILRISDDGVKKYLTREGHGYVLNYSSPWNQLNDLALKALKQYYIAELQKLWAYICGQEHVYMLKEGSFSNTNIVPARLSPDFLTFNFNITEDDRYIVISLQKELNGAIIAAHKTNVYNGFLFDIDGVFYLPADLADLDMLKQFEHGFIKIPLQSREQVIRSFIPLLQRKYKVAVPSSLTVEQIQPEPSLQLLLKELDGKFLVLQPQYEYEGITVNYEPSPDSIFQNLPAGGHRIIERNTEKEKLFFDSLRVLHPRFQKPTMNNFFFLPFEETMKQNWFIETIARLVESNIKVLGMQELKKHRYNTNKPKWEMKGEAA